MDCQPTYEELKHFKPFYSFSMHLRLPAYLWGIETVQSAKYSLITLKLPAYLWGIETGKDLITNTKSFSYCQPTYEELKRRGLGGDFRRRGWLPAYLWGIETHYQSDKQTLLNQLPAYLWGIETFFLLRSENEKKKLPAYLWGIETFTGSFMMKKLLLIASLPMRNWNSEVRRTIFFRNLLPAYLWGIETPLKLI